MTRLAVAPDCRGRGVGRALLAHAVAQAHQRGLRPMSLVLDARRESAALHQHSGFTAVAPARGVVTGQHGWVWQGPVPRVGVRLVGPDLQPAVIRLVAGCAEDGGWPVLSPAGEEGARAWLGARSAGVGLAAVEGGEVIGYMCAYPVPADDPARELWLAAAGPGRELWGIGAAVTAAQARGGGVAALLSQLLTDWLEASGRQPVLATLHAELSDALASRGWVPCGETRTSEGLRCYLHVRACH